MIIETSSPAATQVRYFHRDRLGSLTTISNEAGAVVERLSYDPWGKRRNPNGTDAANLTSAVTDDPGYTGHEMLDDFGLVHMNGRVYDPALARMQSADPLVADADDLQSFNRYAYVVNNPLVYTDPSGFGRTGAAAPVCLTAEGVNCPNPAEQLEKVVIEGKREEREKRSGMSEYVKAGVKVIQCGGGCSISAVGTTVMRGLRDIDRRIGVSQPVAAAAMIRIAPAAGRAAMVNPSLGPDDVAALAAIAVVGIAVAIQSAVNADNAQDLGDATAGDQSGTDSEDQGGDQAKDPKRRFDKGQRDRAVDKVRDDKGEPRCTYCGQKLTDQSGRGSSTEIDHVKAHSRGGKTTDDNSAASCRTCNRSKGSKDPGTEWVPPTR